MAGRISLPLRGMNADEGDRGRFFVSSPEETKNRPLSPWPEMNIL